ncbi:adenosylcobinamide-GDP ribazoletransferase [Sulfitobacter aestuarii]|uniref:Adenosylcobinamide-GDP ribazoletransferase n=1 Tax=Sulfitobacter aestuarii TaxID=2161676 RepID=A0ABW5TXU5_9RHOB
MPENDARISPMQGFLAVLSLLSRLPLPRLPPAAFAATPRMVWAFPLAGALLGSLAALGGALALALGLPAPISAGIVLALLMLLSGAMHEDGLADCFDGFWGGHSPARRLEIMKDSQIGSYGVLALILVTGLRWLALTSLIAHSLWPVILAAALSRSLLPLLMASMKQARDAGLARSVGQPSLNAAFTALAIGAALTFLLSGAATFLILPLALAVTLALRHLALRKIGGQTGDVLGAAQQMSEVTILLCLVSLG